MREPDHPRINLIWERIVLHQGMMFHKIRGEPFTYNVQGNVIALNSTNQNIPKSEINRALYRMPLDSTQAVQDLRAPSYIYAILMDNRIRGNEW
jgi:hypothetical protein